MTNYENEEKNFIRGSIALEKMKFLPPKFPTQKEMEYLTEWETERIEQTWEDVSKLPWRLDLTLLQSQVLYGLQAWLCRALSERNIIKVQRHPKGRCFIPYLPLPKCSEIMEILGCERKVTSRGKKEFLGSERDRVAKALKEILKTELFYNLLTEALLDGHRLIGVSSLGYEDFSEALKSLLVPSPLLLHGLDSNYYLSKPTDMYQNGEKMLGAMDIKRPSKYVFRVLEWIVLQSFLNHYQPVTITPEKLALRIGLYEKYWMAGKKKTAQAYIETGFQLAKNMDYITELKTTGGKKRSSYCFTPNQRKLFPGYGKNKLEIIKTNDYDYIPSQLELKAMITL